MSTKKKLLISLGSLCLVAAIVVVGVFAALSQTFSVTSKITYTARGVESKVYTTVTNGSDSVTVTSPLTEIGKNSSEGSASIADIEFKNIHQENIGTTTEKQWVSDIVTYTFIIANWSDNTNMSVAFTAPSLTGATMTSTFSKLGTASLSNSVLTFTEGSTGEAFVSGGTVAHTTKSGETTTYNAVQVTVTYQLVGSQVESDISTEETSNLSFSFTFAAVAD